MDTTVNTMFCHSDMQRKGARSNRRDV